MMVMRPKHVVWRKSQTKSGCVRLFYSYYIFADDADAAAADDDDRNIEVI
jgi:hypothetical protein